MKRNLLKITAATLLIASFGACKKDSPKSRTELLTQKEWKTVNQEFSTNGAAYVTNPDWTTADACEKDDIIIFRGNMTFEENEGATKCDPTHPQIIESGNWAWLENETKVSINGEVGTITQLDENTLQATVPVNSNINLRVTYSH